MAAEVAVDNIVKMNLFVGRPDGKTWTNIGQFLKAIDINIGDVSNVGTGQSGVDGVVRECSITLHNATNDRLSPRDRESRWNYWNGEYAPLLWPNREIIFEVPPDAPRQRARSINEDAASSLKNGTLTNCRVENNSKLVAIQRGYTTASVPGTPDQYIPHSEVVVSDPFDSNNGWADITISEYNNQGGGIRISGGVLGISGWGQGNGGFANNLKTIGTRRPFTALGTYEDFDITLFGVRFPHYAAMNGSDWIGTKVKMVVKIGSVWLELIHNYSYPWMPDGSNYKGYRWYLNGKQGNIPINITGHDLRLKRSNGILELYIGGQLIIQTDSTGSVSQIEILWHQDTSAQKIAPASDFFTTQYGVSRVWVEYIKGTPPSGEQKYGATAERISPVYTVGVNGNLIDASITWQANAPPGTRVLVYANVAANGTSWAGWKQCQNGGIIPDLQVGTEMKQAKIQFKQVLVMDPGVEVSPEVFSCYATIVAEDSTPIVLFHGYLGDKIGVTRSEITLDCRDLAKKLMDIFIEVTRKYGTETGVPAEEVIQQVIDDNIGIGKIQLYCPVSPGFLIKNYQPEDVSVWEAIQDIAAQIGWFLGFRFNEETGKYQLTFFEPPRSKDEGNADFYLDWTEDFIKQDLNISDTDIRNRVKVTYHDSNDNGRRKSITVEDTDSIQEYGLRSCVIGENDTSIINTAEEANRLGNVALYDLKDLVGTTNVEMPFEPRMDVFCGVVMHYPGLSSTDDFFGVESVSHRLDFVNETFRTEFKGSGKVVGSHRKYLDMETRPGTESYSKRTAANSNVVPAQPRITSVASVAGGLTVWVSPNDNVTTGYDIHVSTTSEFTPNSSTLKASGASGRFDIVGLQAGTQYYVKAVAYAASGIRSEPSQQTAQKAGYVTSTDLAPGTIPVIPPIPEFELFEGTAEDGAYVMVPSGYDPRKSKIIVHITHIEFYMLDVSGGGIFGGAHTDQDDTRYLDCYAQLTDSLNAWLIICNGVTFSGKPIRGRVRYTIIARK